MSGIFTADREMSGISVKITKCQRKKFCQGKLPKTFLEISSTGFLVPVT